MWILIIASRVILTTSACTCFSAQCIFICNSVTSDKLGRINGIAVFISDIFRSVSINFVSVADLLHTYATNRITNFHWCIQRYLINACCHAEVHSRTMPSHLETCSVIPTCMQGVYIITGTKYVFELACIYFSFLYYIILMSIIIGIQDIKEYMNGNKRTYRIIIII